MNKSRDCVVLHDNDTTSSYVIYSQIDFISAQTAFPPEEKVSSFPWSLANDAVEPMEATFLESAVIATRQRF